MTVTSVSWPDMTFGPVNLHSLPPAWFYYMAVEEKAEFMRREFLWMDEETPSEQSSVH